MRNLLVCLLCACLLPTLAWGDCYMKTKTETSGFAGLGGTKGKTERWISGGRSTEKVKVEIKSPVLKMFMKGEETRTVTDLDKGVITWIDDKEKTYRELTFEDMRARVEEAKEQYQEVYAEASADAERQMPKVEEGTAPEIDIQVLAGAGTKKFAGVEAENTVIQMLSTAKDQESGEEVTYKIIYDAWMAKDFPAANDLMEYHRAYAESYGMAIEEMVGKGELGMAIALGQGGLDKASLSPYMEKLEGHPMKFTMRIGVKLTEAQRAELRKEMAEHEKESGGGGGFGGVSLGGLTKKATDAVTGEISDKMVESLFGEGVTVDTEGDPVFFSMTSEVEKVELKPVAEKLFSIGDGYKPESK